MATIRPDNSKIIRTKIVNINARIPVKTTTPPIYGVREHVEMSISDILKCLTRRAIVHQVLSDGSTVQLTTKNFRDDFEGQLQKKKRIEAVKAAKSEVNVEEKPAISNPGPDVDPIVEDKPEPTGNIDDLNLVDHIDDDEDDNSEEPEEAANTIVKRSFVDGTEFEMIGVDPKFPEPSDDEEETPVVEEAAEEKSEETESAEEVTESEETETTVEPVSEEKPVSSTKKKNNSKKSGSKKK